MRPFAPPIFFRTQPAAEAGADETRRDMRRHQTRTHTQCTRRLTELLECFVTCAHLPIIERTTRSPFNSERSPLQCGNSTQSNTRPPNEPKVPMLFIGVGCSNLSGHVITKYCHSLIACTSTLEMPKARTTRIKNLIPSNL